MEGRGSGGRKSLWRLKRRCRSSPSPPRARRCGGRCGWGPATAPERLALSLLAARTRPPQAAAVMGRSFSPAPGRREGRARCWGALPRGPLSQAAPSPPGRRALQSSQRVTRQSCLQAPPGAASTGGRAAARFSGASAPPCFPAPGCLHGPAGAAEEGKAAAGPFSPLSLLPAAAVAAKSLSVSPGSSALARVPTGTRRRAGERASRRWQQRPRAQPWLGVLSAPEEFSALPSLPFHSLFFFSRGVKKPHNLRMCARVEIDVGRKKGGEGGVSSGPCGRRRSAPPRSGFPGGGGGGGFCRSLLPDPPPTPSSLRSFPFCLGEEGRGGSLLPVPPPPAMPGHFCYLETFPPRECSGPSPHGAMDKWHRHAHGSRILALLDTPYSGARKPFPCPKLLSFTTMTGDPHSPQLPLEPPRVDLSLPSPGGGGGGKFECSREEVRVDATLGLQRPLLASQAAVPIGDGLTPWARRAGEAAAAGGLASSARSRPEGLPAL